MQDHPYPNSTPLKETFLNKGALSRLTLLKIETVGDLKHQGSVVCYKKMKKKFLDVHLPKCYNLYDLEAVLIGRKGGWKALLPKEKKILDDQLSPFQS